MPDKNLIHKHSTKTKQVLQRQHRNFPHHLPSSNEKKFAQVVKSLTYLSRNSQYDRHKHRPNPQTEYHNTRTANSLQYLCPKRREHPWNKSRRFAPPAASTGLNSCKNVDPSVERPWSVYPFGPHPRTASHPAFGAPVYETECII